LTPKYNKVKIYISLQVDLAVVGN